MPKQETQEFFQVQAIEVSLQSFLVNLVLTALLAFLLGRLYVRCGTALSDRRSLAGTFVLLAITTMLVISVVKSSLALSLGLVGALSIVRFRAAIKEPEELVYLFLCIAIGLGLGADQWRITLVAFLFIGLIVIVKDRFAEREERQNLFLTISSVAPDKVALEDVVEVLSAHCAGVSVTRFDETGEVLEASFRIDVADFKRLSAMKDALRGLNESIEVTFLESRGVA